MTGGRGRLSELVGCYSLLTLLPSACEWEPLIKESGNRVAQATVHNVRMPRVNMRKATPRTRARRR